MLGQLLQEFKGKVRVAHKDFPLPSHAGALPAAEAARCASSQGVFWEYHDILYLSVPDFSRDDLVRYAGRLSIDREAFAACIDTRFASKWKPTSRGAARAVSGPRPPSGQRHAARRQPIDAFHQAIREALKEAGARGNDHASRQPLRHSASPWVERRPGVFWKTLWEDTDGRPQGRPILTPGSVIAPPPHGDEQIWVLGSVADDTGVSWRATARRPPGCVRASPDGARGVRVDLRVGGRSTGSGLEASLVEVDEVGGCAPDAAPGIPRGCTHASRPARRK